VTDDWRAARNLRALDGLMQGRHERFPESVWRHAVARPLVPPTLTRAVESYWRHHPLRADWLARALAARSGAPEGWSWQVGRQLLEGSSATFRSPPTPYRCTAFARGPGHCCICGQPVYRFGWHADVCGDGAPNRRATWHLACVAAWKFWNAPSDQVRLLRPLQRHRCVSTGQRLLRSSEVDHRTPLFRVWRDYRDLPWPTLLGFWGLPNLRVVNRDAHVRKSLDEATERRAVGRRSRAVDARPQLTAADVIFYLSDPLD
jgi:hypothetical protein